MRYILCCLVLMGSNVFAERKIDKVVMVVNDMAITQYDQDLFYQATLAMTPDHMRDQASHDLHEHQADLMVNQALMLNLAASQNIDVSETMVDDFQNKVQAGLRLEDSEFLAHLTAFNLTESQFRDHLRNGLAASLVQQNIVKSLVKITPTMVEQYTKEKQENASMYVFNDYLIKPEGLSEQEQAQMAALLAKEITAKTRIPEKVKPHVMRTPFVDVQKNSIPQAFFSKLSTAQPPQVIQAFKIANGYHVIWYRDKKLAPAIPQAQAMREIGEPKAQEAFAKWLSEMRDASYIHHFS